MFVNSHILKGIDVMMNNTVSRRTDYQRFLPMTLPAALVALILVSSCQPQERAQETMGQSMAIDTMAVLSSIDSLRNNYQDAVNEGNFEMLSTLVTGDAIMVQPGTTEWDAMREASRGPFPEGATITITPAETKVLSNDWAYDMGSSTITYTPADSDEPVTLKDTYLVILKRTTDGWKVHREVASAMPLGNK